MKLRKTFYKGNKICWAGYAILVMLDGVINLVLSVILHVQQILELKLY